MRTHHRRTEPEPTRNDAHEIAVDQRHTRDASEVFVLSVLASVRFFILILILNFNFIFPFYLHFVPASSSDNNYPTYDKNNRINGDTSLTCAYQFQLQFPFLFLFAFDFDLSFRYGDVCSFAILVMSPVQKCLSIVILSLCCALVCLRCVAVCFERNHGDFS